MSKWASNKDNGHVLSEEEFFSDASLEDAVAKYFNPNMTKSKKNQNQRNERREERRTKFYNGSGYDASKERRQPEQNQKREYQKPEVLATSASKEAVCENPLAGNPAPVPEKKQEFREEQPVKREEKAYYPMKQGDSEVNIFRGISSGIDNLYLSDSYENRLIFPIGDVLDDEMLLSNNPNWNTNQGDIINGLATTMAFLHKTWGRPDVVMDVDDFHDILGMEGYTVYDASKAIFKMIPDFVLGWKIEEGLVEKWKEIIERLLLNNNEDLANAALRTLAILGEHLIESRFISYDNLSKALSSYLTDVRNEDEDEFIMNVWRQEPEDPEDPKWAKAEEVSPLSESQTSAYMMAFGEFPEAPAETEENNPYGDDGPTMTMEDLANYAEEYKIKHGLQTPDLTEDEEEDPDAMLEEMQAAQKMQELEYSKLTKEDVENIFSDAPREDGIKGYYNSAVEAGGAPAGGNTPSGTNQGANGNSSTEGQRGVQSNSKSSEGNGVRNTETVPNANRNVSADTPTAAVNAAYARAAAGPAGNNAGNGKGGEEKKEKEERKETLGSVPSAPVKEDSEDDDDEYIIPVRRS